jgi:hypothetical protein
MAARVVVPVQVFTLLVLASVPRLALGAEAESLALCGKCLNPTVVSKSGIGTERAQAEARMTRQGAEAWCANWEPDDHACVRQQLSGEEGKSYRASADCQHGRLTAVDGKGYSFAGFWTSDVGRGRSRWRDPDGKLVGQDEASGGLALAQQWELLCPGDTRSSAASGQGPGQASGLAYGQAASQMPGQVSAPGDVAAGAPGQDFSGGMGGTGSTPPTPFPASAAGTASSPDACTPPRCFNAGPFTATVTQLLEGQVGPRHDPAVRVGVTFRNLGQQPIALAYVSGSSALSDSTGARYAVGAPGAPDSSAQGIGKVEGRNADPRFVLQPGETRDALFQLLRDPAARRAQNTTYSYSVGIAQLDVLQGNQVRMVRNYRLAFPGVTAGMVTAGTGPSPQGSGKISDAVKDLESAAKKFSDIFQGK